MIKPIRTDDKWNALFINEGYKNKIATMAALLIKLIKSNLLKEKYFKTEGSINKTILFFLLCKPNKNKEIILRKSRKLFSFTPKMNDVTNMTK
ncbi:hypothetical protein J6TS2_41560 [Heyndrickxia sporothermodurans]|nr:hypothetical protein J6TS2_41560 [Heyndrickxia sporothermodurans]